METGMTASPSASAPSPRWSSTAKLIFGLTFAALIFALIISFRGLIGPLILAFVVTYLLHPVAAGVSRITRLPWVASVVVVYLVLIVLFIGSFTWSGVVIVHQIESLVGVVQQFVNDIPNLARQLTSQVYTIGPFHIVLSEYFDLNAISDQLLRSIQPILTQVTSLLGTVATGAAEMIGWTLFVLLVSYFLLSDVGRVPDSIAYIRIPGYDTDVHRMGNELGRIWNAFLRGQLLIFVLVSICYTLLMTILGMRFALGIAILAGLARFVPYIGPFVTWVVTILVAILQGPNYFGLDPIKYAVIVIISAVVLDQIFDNFVSPQIMGQSLRVRPVTILLGALLAANLIGIIGVVLAAPVVATLKLLGTYAFRKMLDLDPWPESVETLAADSLLKQSLLRRIRGGLQVMLQKFNKSSSK
jgi:predicted PurR-regulated permease PerM